MSDIPPPPVPDPQLPISETHKGFAMVRNTIVETINYYDLGTNTDGLDNQPVAIAIPQDQLDEVIPNWVYVNGQFSAP